MWWLAFTFFQIISKFFQLTLLCSNPGFKISASLSCMNFIFYLAVSISKSFQCVFNLTLLCSNPGFDKSYCISVTFNNFAESKREQSLAFCLSIIMCMNFIFYLVVGFSKQFHLAYGFEANKMRSSKKNAS